MSQTLRTTVFWIHLAAGVTAGSIVAVMALTGAALAFQPQILEWAERETAVVQPAPPGTRRLPLEALLERVQAEGGSPGAVTVYSAPDAAVRVASGRDSVHVNPYTGEVRPAAGQGWRRLLQTLVEVHRYLRTSGDGRPVGKTVTGVANAAFLFLALSGLYLWWPRRWSTRSLRLSFWFRRGLTGKTRDWNWHNVIGFWSLPVLIVITASGMMISFRWATTLVYKAAGEAGPPPPTSPPKVRTPARGTRPLGLQALADAGARAVPSWKSIALRGKAPGPVSLTVREVDAWPLFASTQLALDPYSGQVLTREGYATFSPGRQLRTWLRFLHTGEALGWPGQLLAGVVSLGASVLVWTGLALAFRRFFRRRERTAAVAPAASLTPEAGGSV